jgi:hypothetical protein
LRSSSVSAQLSPGLASGRFPIAAWVITETIADVCRWHIHAYPNGPR